jgi:citrate synthase
MLKLFLLEGRRLTMFVDEVINYICEKECGPREYELLNSLASIFIEFPIDNEPPSSAVVALAANCGAALPNALASGLSCISDQHLPIEQIAKFISLNYNESPSEVFRQFKNKNLKIPGFGHPSIKGEDDRVIKLKNNFKDLYGDRTRFCIQLERHMPVPMNIGCIIASLSLDNGIKANNCIYLPLMGRMLGWLKLYNKTKTRFNKVVPSFENIKNDNQEISK